MQTLLRNLLPFSGFAFVAFLPRRGAVEKAWTAGNRGGQSVGTDCEAADLNQSERGATDFRSGSVDDEPLAGEQTKTTDEEVDAAGNGGYRQQH